MNVFTLLVGLLEFSIAVLLYSVVLPEVADEYSRGIGVAAMVFLAIVATIHVLGGLL